NQPDTNAVNAPVLQKAPTPGPVTRGILSNPSGGHPLPSSARNTMEHSLHENLRDVRIHTGAQASDAARELGAHAFTHGRDIYFGEGRFQPSTTEGRRLLAHE